MKTISLTKGHKAIVDDEDFERFSVMKWHSSHGRPVIRNKNGTKWLHREIMGVGEGLVVDHINGDPLDNRKSNLRICTPKDNYANKSKTTKKTSSKFKGVYYARRNKNKWQAYIGSASIGTRENLGSFPTEKEAAQAYNKRASELYGEFAKLNNIGVLL